VIDVHCHLADTDFDRDRGEVMARAREAGVTAFIVVGEDYESNLRVLDLASRHTDVFPALGHHPWNLETAKVDLPRTLALIENHADQIVAIGEVGLDNRKAPSEPERASQRALLRELIQVARGLDLPLSVHVRSAGHYVLDLLDEMGSPAAALHAFDGKVGYALAGAGKGYCFSIPGTVLVSQQKRKLAAGIPLDRLLLESDAPALSPVRGQRNEPAILAQVVAEVAQIRRLTVEEVKAAAEGNTRRLFRRLHA
jgi:TatD DNase family protein